MHIGNVREAIGVLEPLVKRVEPLLEMSSSVLKIDTL